METLRKNIIAREVHITLLCMFDNVIPKDIINVILQFAGLYEKSKNITFDSQIKKARFLLRPDDTMSIGAINVLNDFINVLIAKFVAKSMTLTEYMRQNTISSRTIQSVVRLLTSGKYERKLVSQGTMIVTKYNANTSERSNEEKRQIKRLNIANIIGTFIGPARVEKAIRSNLDNDYFQFKISKGASIYLTAVINQVVGDIIKMSGNDICTNNIINTVKNNYDLKSLYHELFI